MFEPDKLMETYAQLNSGEARLSGIRYAIEQPNPPCGPHLASLWIAGIIFIRFRSQIWSITLKNLKAFL